MRSLRLIALLAIPTQVSLSQQTPSVPSSLSVEDAIGIARRNNPGYLQTANTLKNADAQLRTTYGALLPTSNTSFSTRYQQGGTQVISGLALGASGDTKQSAYALNLNYSISSAALFAPKAARASRDATEATISDGAESLRSLVTQQYITVLQAQARAALQDTLVQTAQGQLDLAKAKVAVGAGTALDTRRAEVALGQSQVASLTAHNTAEIEMLRLFQELGVQKSASPQLTTKFPITPPTFTLDSLLDVARRANPALNSLRSSERSSALNVHAARTLYTPSLSLSTGWGGNSLEYADPEFLVAQSRASLASQQRSCYSQDSLRTRVGLSSLPCGTYVLTDDQAAAIRASNNKFPFKFNRNPIGVSAFLSFTIFDGFRELEQALIDRVNAIYDYHKAFAALESAVGRPLR